MAGGSRKGTTQHTPNPTNSPKKNLWRSSAIWDRLNSTCALVLNDTTFRIRPTISFPGIRSIFPKSPVLKFRVSFLQDKVYLKTRREVSSGPIISTDFQFWHNGTQLKSPLPRNVIQTLVPNCPLNRRPLPGHCKMIIRTLPLGAFETVLRQSTRHGCLRQRVIGGVLKARGFHLSAAAREREFDPRTIEQESDDVDVCIVGGGPAGLSAAIRLKQLAAKQDREVRVLLLEKGSEMGIPPRKLLPRAFISRFPVMGRHLLFSSM